MGMMTFVLVARSRSKGWEATGTSLQREKETQGVTFAKKKSWLAKGECSVTYYLHVSGQSETGFFPTWSPAVWPWIGGSLYMAILLVSMWENVSGTMGGKPYMAILTKFRNPPAAAQQGKKKKESDLFWS